MRYILNNGKTYCDRDLEAVNLTTMIIPLLILAPTFCELPLLEFQFAFQNDKKVAHLHRWHWSGMLLHHLALKKWRVLPKFGLQDCNNFVDHLIASSTSVPSWRGHLENPQNGQLLCMVKVNGESIKQGEVWVLRNIVCIILQTSGKVGNGLEFNDLALDFDKFYVV